MFRSKECSEQFTFREFQLEEIIKIIEELPEYKINPVLLKTFHLKSWSTRVIYTLLLLRNFSMNVKEVEISLIF